MGPASHSGHLNHVGWVRLPKNISLGAPDPTGGENSPHIELSLVSISATAPELTVAIPEQPQGRRGTNVRRTEMI